MHIVGELFGRLVADHSIPFDRLALAAVRELTLQNEGGAQLHYILERSIRVRRIATAFVAHVRTVIFGITAQTVRYAGAVAAAELLGRALLTRIVYL